MLAVTSNTITSKLHEYFDKVCDQAETVFVTREQEKNVVIISEDKYNAMLREINNAKFIEKLDISEEQIQNGEVVTMTLDELRGLKDA